MNSDQPLVSIGVPIYNDRPYLCNALERMLAQDYRNLEIILADDGSSDGSREICREYVERDARIRLFENKHNLGALQNHKFVFDVSKGDYFAWGSGHDYFHPAFISSLFENLQNNPSVVMCCPQSVFMDENGEIFRTTKGGLDTRGLPPVGRLEKLLAHLVSGGTANIFYGLYRQEALAQVSLLRKGDGSDVIMLGELSLLGEMMQVDTVLYNRITKKSESGKLRAKRHVTSLVDTHGFKLEMLMPYFSASCEFLNIAENDRLSAIEQEIVHKKIVELDVNIGRAAIADEIMQFISVARSELTSLDAHLHIQQYRAAQILGVLGKAWLLGFGHDGLHELRSICLSAMGLQAEASAAEQETASFYRREKMQRTFNQYQSKVVDALRKLIGDKAWKSFRRVLSISFHLLPVIWIIAVMFLYLLLFSPPLYWGVLKRLGLASTLDAWRILIIDFFELRKGFH